MHNRKSRVSESRYPSSALTFVDPATAQHSAKTSFWLCVRLIAALSICRAGGSSTITWDCEARPLCRSLH